MPRPCRTGLRRSFPRCGVLHDLCTSPVFFLTIFIAISLAAPIDLGPDTCWFCRSYKVFIKLVCLIIEVMIQMIKVVLNVLNNTKGRLEHLLQSAILKCTPCTKSLGVSMPSMPGASITPEPKSVPEAIMTVPEAIILQEPKTVPEVVLALAPESVPEPTSEPELILASEQQPISRQGSVSGHVLTPVLEKELEAQELPQMEQLWEPGLKSQQEPELETLECEPQLEQEGQKLIEIEQGAQKQNIINEELEPELDTDLELQEETEPQWESELVPGLKAGETKETMSLAEFQRPTGESKVQFEPYDESEQKAEIKREPESSTSFIRESGHYHSLEKEPESYVEIEPTEEGFMAEPKSVKHEDIDEEDEMETSMQQKTSLLPKPIEQDADTKCARYTERSCAKCKCLKRKEARSRRSSDEERYKSYMSKPDEEEVADKDTVFSKEPEIKRVCPKQIKSSSKLPSATDADRSTLSKRTGSSMFGESKPSYSKIKRSSSSAGSVRGTTDDIHPKTTSKCAKQPDCQKKSCEKRKATSGSKPLVNSKLKLEKSSSSKHKSANGSRRITEETNLKHSRQSVEDASFRRGRQSAEETSLRYSRPSIEKTSLRRSYQSAEETSLRRGQEETSMRNDLPSTEKTSSKRSPESIETTSLKPNRQNIEQTPLRRSERCCEDAEHTDSCCKLHQTGKSYLSKSIPAGRVNSNARAVQTSDDEQKSVSKKGDEKKREVATMPTEFGEDKRAPGKSHKNEAKLPHCVCKEKTSCSTECQD